MNVSFHPSGWRKAIGKHRFYFGDDEETATIRAMKVWCYWKELRITKWNKATMNNAAQIAKGIDPFSSISPDDIDDPNPNDPMIDPPKAPAEETIIGWHMALDSFKSVVRSDDTIKIDWQCELSKRLDTLKLVHNDMPLDLFDADTVKNMVTYWNGRPITPRRKTGKCSISYCRMHIAAIRLFTNWLDGQYNWSEKLPTNLFCTRRLTRSMSGEERMKAASNPTFTIEELKKLWDRKSERLQLCMCLALNCAMKQAELSDLRLGEIHLNDDAAPFIRRLRGKTNVLGEWRLWDITTTLIRRELLKHPTPKLEDCLILTEHNKPLVWRSEKGTRVDSVRLLFTRHRDMAGISKLGFKHIEKTAANMIAQKYGAEIASTFVGHGKPVGNIDPIIYAYTNKRFEKMIEATEWLRDELSPIFGDRPKPIVMGGLRLVGT